MEKIGVQVPIPPMEGKSKIRNLLIEKVPQNPVLFRFPSPPLPFLTNITPPNDCPQVVVKMEPIPLNSIDCYGNYH